MSEVPGDGAGDDYDPCEDCEAPLKGDDTFCEHCDMRPTAEAESGLTPKEMIAMPRDVRRKVLAIAAEVAAKDAEIERLKERIEYEGMEGNALIAALKAKLAKAAEALRSAPKPPFRHGAEFYMAFWEKRTAALKQIEEVEDE